MATEIKIQILLLQATISKLKEEDYYLTVISNQLIKVIQLMLKILMSILLLISAMLYFH